MSQKLEDGRDLLKLAIQVVNDKSNPLRSTNGDIHLKDFDNNMSGKLMIDVVASILACIDPNFQKDFSLRSAGRLHPFEHFGFPPIVYDSTPSWVYKVARKFFPDDDETLDLNLFIMPQFDVKRAKQVIVFLMGYFITSDQAHERFEAEWERLNSENQEKVRLYEDIEGLRNTIADNVVALQSAKDAKPQAEEELKELENQVLIDMKTLTALQENSAVGKKAYDSKAAGIKHLQAELDALLAEKERLEGCIVPSPQEIQHLYDIEKQKCAEDEKKRSALGVEIREVGQKEIELSKVIDRAAQTVIKFGELIKLLHTAGEKGNLLSSDSKHLENILREIEERQADVDRGGSDQDHLQGEFTKRMEFLDQECAKQNDILQTEERNLDNIEFRINEIMAKLEDIDIEMNRSKNSKEQCMSDIQELKIILKKCLENYALRLDRQIGQVTTLCRTFLRMHEN